MARTVLEVVVAGDSKSLERAMGRSSKSVDKFGKDADKATKRVGVAFKGLGRAAAFGGGALAVGGFASIAKGAATAAIESEKSGAKLRAQMKASGLSMGQYGKSIEGVIAKQSRLSGIDDEKLQDAFTNIVRSTGDVSKSMGLLSLATDISRAKNIEAAKAGELVAKVANGNTSALSRYGITLAKGATATEALGALQQKFGGQARAYGETTAGANDRFRVAVENLQEKLGAKLLPALSSVATAATRFVSQMENGTGAGGRFADISGRIAAAVGGVVSKVGGFVRGFRDGNAAMVVLGGTMASLVAGFVAFRVITTVVAAMGALKAAVIAVNVAMRANPFVAVATVVAALGAALVVAYKKSETFRNVVDGVFRSVKTIVGNSIAFVLRTLDKFLGGISSVASVAGSLPGVGKLFDGVAGKVDKARESLRSAADQADRLGRIRVDTSQIDAAIRKAGGLKDALNGSPVTLTARPRKPVGDVSGPVGGSVAGGLLGGLTSAARGGFASVAKSFGGVRLTSGFRTPAQNAAVGGAKNSDHLTGNAIDLVPAEGWNPKSIARFDKIAAWAKRQSNVRFIGWRGDSGHGPGDHLHISFAARARQLGQRHGDPKGKYSIADMKGLAMSVGLGEHAASVAAAVGMAESGGNPRAFGKNSNGTVDRGLWQINSIHGAGSTFSVAGNAKAMARISKGGRSFQPWAAYSGPDFRGSDGPWRKFFAKAKAAKPGKTTAAGRKKIMMGKMGASSIVPLNAVEQARADAAAEMAGYSPSGGGGADVGGGGTADGPTGDPVLDALNAQVALSGLTKDTGDDLSALGGVEGELTRRLAAAQASGDNAAIIGLAESLKGVRDQIEGLTAAMKENTLEIERARADAERQLKEQAMQRERLSQSQYGVLSNALADVVNGTLGGRIGLGYQTPSFPGAGARY